MQTGRAFARCPVEGYRNAWPSAFALSGSFEVTKVSDDVDSLQEQAMGAMGRQFPEFRMHMRMHRGVDYGIELFWRCRLGLM